MGIGSKLRRFFALNPDYEPDMPEPCDEGKHQWDKLTNNLGIMPGSFICKKCGTPRMESLMSSED